MVIKFELAKAREAFLKAKRALKEAEGQVVRKGGVGISLAIVNRIRAAERRVDEARSKLRRIDPTSTE